MKRLIRPGEVHLAIPFSHLLCQRVLLLICMAHTSLEPGATKMWLKKKKKNLFQGIRRNRGLAHMSSPRTSDCKFHKHVLGIWKGISHYKRNLNFNRLLYEMKTKDVETQPSPGPTLCLTMVHLLLAFPGSTLCLTTTVENFLLTPWITGKKEQKAFARVWWSSQAKLGDHSQERGRHTQEMVVKQAWRTKYRGKPKAWAKDWF